MVLIHLDLNVLPPYYLHLLIILSQAAKYLDQSSNAKEAFELALKKEATKQLEIQENTKYYNPIFKQYRKIELSKTQIEQEEKRKTRQYETEMSKRRAEYQVQLELQRDQEKL